MTSTVGPLEIVIGAGLVATAVVTLSARRRLSAAVSFLVFGVVLAAVWAVMGAPDIAIAEAALGTGITGALFLETITRIERSRGGASSGSAPAPRARRWPAAVAAAALGIALVPVILRVAGRAGDVGLRAPVAQSLDDSGVTHPITAVLLAFRAYDTLLEIAVLLLAVMVAGSMWPPATVTGADTATRPVLLGRLVTLSAPVLVVAAGWLLFAGSSLPGGAFQAGAVLGGMLVLIRISGVANVPGWLLTVGAAIGLLTFVAVAAAGLLLGGWLTLPSQGAGTIIVALEALLALSIGIGLAVLVLATGEASPRSAEVST